MARPYSMDLRQRVIGAVEEERLSRHEAASRFGVSASAAIKWVKRFETTGSMATGQIGGHPPKANQGEHPRWLRARSRQRGLTPRGVITAVAERGPLGGYLAVGELVLAAVPSI